MSFDYWSTRRMQYFLEKLKTKIPTVNIVDNLTTNDATKVLSAKQGKILNDKKIDKVASEIKTNTTGQFDTVTGGKLLSCILAFTPKQSGSGTPSPSNIRPITGHTSGEVLRRGKNWLNSTLASGTTSSVVYTALGDGTYNLNGTNSTNGGADFATNVFLKAGTYKILGLPSGVGSSSCYIGLMSGGSYVYTSNDASFTLSEDTTFDSLRLRPGTGKQFNNVIVKPMITTDLSATYDSYEPYNEQDITIQFGDTYYGGTFDFVSGILTATHKYVKLTSSSQLGGFATSAQYGAYAYVNDTADCLATDGSKVYGLCSMCEYVSFDNRLTTANVNRVWSDKNNTKLFVRASVSSNVSTVTELYNIFATAEICYELATPIEIQLSPSQINTLVGQNNLSAPLDGQSIQSAQYREVLSWDDTKPIYENTVPEQGYYNLFKIHRYGRIVELKFSDAYAIPMSSGGTECLGILNERFYHKYPNAFVAENMCFCVGNESSPDVITMKKVTINQFDGGVYATYEQDEQIRPLGNIVYILDHD